MGPDTVLTTAQSITSNSTAIPETLYLISGSFSAVFLYILAFNTRTHQLSVSSRYDAFGPHQWVVTNDAFDRLYATSWAWPPSLYSWKILWDSGVPSLTFLNQAPITAISSYISLRDSYAYSIGGPTGEVHALSEERGFGKKLQELLYVPPDELADADKTRKALRDGSHGIEFTKQGKAFVPHLGTNSIWVYDLEEDTGKLQLVGETKSIRKHDGPRHALPHPNGKYLYVVTEHTSFLDVYEIIGDELVHRQSASLIPSDRSPDDFRGDTLRLSRRSDSLSYPPFLFATTRGKNPSHRGYLAAISLDASGLMTSILDFTAAQAPFSFVTNQVVEPVHLFETPTSGGKANAISLAPYEISSAPECGGSEGVEWLVLTDDEEGFVFVVEWSARRGTFEELSRVRLGGSGDDEEGEKGEKITASHAVWLA